MAKIKDNRVKEIVTDLRERVMSISDDIEEKATKEHIIFKSSINFAAIYPQKKIIGLT